jgi:hypothetical protein
MVVVVVLVVFEAVVFCLAWAEPTNASALTNSRVKSVFFITGVLDYKVKLYSKAFCVVNSQLTVRMLARSAK